MVNFPVSRLDDNLAQQILQITFGFSRSPTPMQNLLGNISGLYLIAVAKVVDEIPWVELWKQADCSKTYKLDKDY